MNHKNQETIFLVDGRPINNSVVTTSELCVQLPISFCISASCFRFNPTCTSSFKFIVKTPRVNTIMNDIYIYL